MDSIEQPSQELDLKHSRKKSRSKSLDKSHKRSTSNKRDRKEKLTMLEQ